MIKYIVKLIALLFAYFLSIGNPVFVFLSILVFTFSKLYAEGLHHWDVISGYEKIVKSNQPGVIKFLLLELFFSMTWLVLAFSTIIFFNNIELPLIHKGIHIVNIPISLMWRAILYYKITRLTLENLVNYSHEIYWSNKKYQNGVRRLTKRNNLQLYETKNIDLSSSNGMLSNIGSTEQ